MTDCVHEWKPELYSRGAYCNHDGCAIRLNPEQVESMLNAAEQLPPVDEHFYWFIDKIRTHPLLTQIEADAWSGYFRAYAKARGGE